MLYALIMAGVENVLDHGTIGSRTFLEIPENIQHSVAEAENVKEILAVK